MSRPVKHRVAITGVGLTSPLGRSAAETWQLLLAGHYITDHAKAAGEWDHPNDHSRAARMAIQAAREAITQSNWHPDDDPPSTAILVGTSKGSLERWITPLPHMSDKPYETGGLLSPEGLADIASTLSQELDLPASPKLTLSAACASGLIALIRAAMLLESRQARRALVVATEASVHPLFLASFARLGVLPKPGVGCRPFDLHRDGFLMSEAAAAVCLQAGGQDGLAASAAGGPARIQIDRYALGADATHLTGSDPDGRVLRHLINEVTNDRPVDLIHAHGTGTPSNDPIELAALESVFESAVQAPCLYSHKAALGHSLGAAGLLSVVLNTLVHRHQTIPGNVRTTHPLSTRHVALSPTAIYRPVRRSIALASGFGGATAAISLISHDFGGKPPDSAPPGRT